MKKLLGKRNKNGLKILSKRFKVVLALLLLILFVVGIFYTLKLFKLKKVDLEILESPCIEQGDASNLITSQIDNILLFDNKKIEEKIKKKYLCIESVKVNRKLLDSLEVKIAGRKPAVVINIIELPDLLQDLEVPDASDSSETANLNVDLNQATSSGKFLADKTGFIYAKAENQNSLPEIQMVIADLSLGKSLPVNIIRVVLTVEKELKKLSMSASKIVVLNQKLIFESSPKVIFSLEKDINRQLASLQLILQKAKISARPIENIDLRFDKPVVIYSPKK